MTDRDDKSKADIIPKSTPLKTNGHEEEDCQITKHLPSKAPKKKRNILFSKEEKLNISSNQMLTDESMSLAQKYLKEQFPDFSGLFDTTLMKLNMSDIISKTTKYIQIINLGNLHWVCASSTSTSGIRIHNIFDSLSGNRISNELKRVVAEYSMCREVNLQLKIQPVQQQNNGVDCGVFAIAFATSLAHGNDPCTAAYNVSLMRSHLIKCLQQKKMELFPTTPKRIRRCIPKKFTVPIYCHCRLPYFENKDKMVQCSQCDEWFHFKCETIHGSKNMAKVTWQCQECVKKNGL